MVVKHYFLIAVFIMTFMLTACSDDKAALVKGQSTPAFSLQNLQQKNIHFPDQFNDRVVLISFWADWCPSCKKELHDFENLYQKYDKEGLSVLAINIAQDRETAISFIDDLNLSYEVLLDSKGDIAVDYAVMSLPLTLIIGRDGRLHTRILGETPASVFEEIITSLL